MPDRRLCARTHTKKRIIPKAKPLHPTLCSPLQSDDHSGPVPLLPIPNRTVKRVCADDSAPACVKVGHRQTPYGKSRSSTLSCGFFVCPNAPGLFDTTAADASRTVQKLLRNRSAICCTTGRVCRAACCSVLWVDFLHRVASDSPVNPPHASRHFPYALMQPFRFISPVFVLWLKRGSKGRRAPRRLLISVTRFYLP